MKKGDKSSYQIIFERYYAPLVRYAVLYVKDKDNAEEVVQDYFYQLWIKKENLNISSSLKSYLYTSIRNCSLNYIRGNKDHLDIQEELNQFELVSEAHEHSEIDLDIIKRQVKSAVDSLPEKCKVIFKLSRYEELTYKQISEKLKLSPKTVENQMGIALRKMREKLNPLLKSMMGIIYFANFLFEKYF